MDTTTEIIKFLTAIIVLVTVLIKLFADGSKDKPQATTETKTSHTVPRWARVWAHFVYIVSALTILSAMFGPQVTATRRDVATLAAAFLMFLVSDKYLDATKR
jgi:formate hydrogenlyase subunit 3/multisubunit Na+/H+ antiporter MnhD subunit